MNLVGRQADNKLYRNKYNQFIHGKSCRPTTPMSDTFQENVSFSLALCNLGNTRLRRQFGIFDDFTPLRDPSESVCIPKTDASWVITSRV